MAATFHVLQSNGAGNTVTEIASSGNAFNFMDADVANPALYSANPILFGQSSYEVWLRFMFAGHFNQIRDVRFWQSVDFSPNTGVQIKWKGTQQIFLQPASVTSSIATSSIPTADPGGSNVSIGGNVSGSIVTSSGTTDFVVLQLQTTTAAPSGDTSLSTLSISWSES